MDKIFNNLKNKRKLKIIKYNKKLLDKLNITKDNFKVYKILKEFNKKYDIYIEDIDIKELNLNRKCIDNEGLQYLKRIEFKNLNKLDLSENNISDINILEKVNFKELKELNLSNDYITKTDILQNVNLKDKKIIIN